MTNRTPNNQQNHTDQQTSKKTSKRQKWSITAMVWINKIGNKIKELMDVLFALFLKSLDVLGHGSGLITASSQHPEVICTIVVGIVGLVFLITAFQWGSLGVWLGASLNQPSSILGISWWFIGLIFGFIINTFEQASELWKLKGDLQDYYRENKIDVDAKDIKKTPATRGLDWEHKQLKYLRLFSYSLESVLIVAFSLRSPLGTPDFIQNILTGVFCLVFPELTITIANIVIQVFGGAVNYKSEKYDKDTYNF